MRPWRAHSRWPLLVLLVPCASAATAQISFHSPLVVENEDDVTITAVFAAPKGIASIDITVTSGKMKRCALPDQPTAAALHPCQEQATAQYWRCDFSALRPSPAPVACRFKPTLTEPDLLVTYSAIAKTREGNRLEAKEIAFVRGDAPKGLSRPIVWHRTAEAGTKLRLGLFPDRDYGGAEGYEDFIVDVKRLLESTFGGQSPADTTYTQVYASARSAFDLWLGPPGAHATAGCHRKFEGDAEAARGLFTGTFRAAVIVHKKPFADCATVSFGGQGSVFSRPPGHDSDFLLVHESGHFFFRLYDEYACGGAHKTADGCRNVFKDQKECGDYASHDAYTIDGVTLKGAQCVEMKCHGQPIGYWRLDGNQETMKDREKGSNWRLASRQCVKFGLACLSSKCDEQPKAFVSWPPPEFYRPITVRSADPGPPHLPPTDPAPVPLQDDLVPALAVTFTLTDDEHPRRYETTAVPVTVSSNLLPSEGAEASGFHNLLRTEVADQQLRVSLCADPACSDEHTMAAAVPDQKMNALEGMGEIDLKERTYTVLLRDTKRIKPSKLRVILLNKESVFLPF
jgi:hypothetical protein